MRLQNTLVIRRLICLSEYHVPRNQHYVRLCVFVGWHFIKYSPRVGVRHIMHLLQTQPRASVTLLGCASNLEKMALRRDTCKLTLYLNIRAFLYSDSSQTVVVCTVAKRPINYITHTAGVFVCACVHVCTPNRIRVCNMCGML